MSASHLVVDLSERVLTVTINRPEKRNALSRAVLEEVRQTFTAAASNETIRVAVLRGAGEKSFAAGGDLRDLSTIRTRTGATEMANQAKAVLDSIRKFPLPVVAALNGDALGGGAELAAACDFRILAAHARIGFIQGKLNIGTAWGGGIDLLQLVGPAIGLRLLSRSELLDAPAALSMGLVDAVAKPDQSLDDLLQQFLAPMLRQAPQVMRAFKALALQVRAGRSRSELEALETDLFSDTWIHEDHWTAADNLLK
jgi:enoyl-CoA hydratase